jgi:hypothetical protein
MNDGYGQNANSFDRVHLVDLLFHGKSPFLPAKKEEQSSEDHSVLTCLRPSGFFRPDLMENAVEYNHPIFVTRYRMQVNSILNM